MELWEKILLVLITLPTAATALTVIRHEDGSIKAVAWIAAGVLAVLVGIEVAK